MMRGHPTSAYLGNRALDMQAPTGSRDPSSIAATIRDFYERHPYPGYVEGLDGYRDTAADVPGKRADHHLLWPRLRFREDHTVLVAGCGTMQAVKRAMRWPQARITGIDISEASLAQAREIKARYGLDNLQLHRLPAERVGELGSTFDEIVCTGVLHHLPDPDAGLAALRGVLARAGAMHLMVYAPHGRAGVYLIQDYCRRLGIGSTPGEIRDLAATLRLLPDNHPLWPLLQNSPDFRYDAGLADALLHPQDRAYSVPQLLAFVRENGLRFGRWLRQAPYLPHCGTPARSPHFEQLAALDPAGQFAAMELFRGDMTRHTAIVYRDDAPAGLDPINFGEDGWLDYRPIRRPGAICVQEMPPPGAAGVLINRQHTDRDIYLPVDAAGRDIHAAIDGEATVRDLLARHAPAAGSRFFERLWDHDQIVFDAVG